MSEIVRKGVVVITNGKAEWFAPPLSDIPDGTYEVEATWKMMEEPVPARIPWPWPDVNRVRVGKQFVNIAGQNRRWVDVFLGNASAETVESISCNQLGTWPPNESRIARNVDGFVVLEKCDDNPEATT